MHNIQFADPDILWGLTFIVPAVAILCWMAMVARQRAEGQYADQTLMYGKRRGLSGIGAAAVASIAAVLLVVANALPIRPGVPAKVKSGTVEAIVVADSSWSMAAEDYRSMLEAKDGGVEVQGPYGSRLQMAKVMIIDQLMPALDGNRMGIVTYCGESLEQAPLTNDFRAEKWVMTNFMKVGYAPKDGSNYLAGFKKAILMFKGSRQKPSQRVIIWISDGGMTAAKDDLDKVVEEMHTAHIKLFVVAMGFGSGSVIPQYSSSGQKSGLFDKGNTLATVELENLTEVAEKMQTTVIRYQPGETPAGLKIASTLAATASEATDGVPLFRYPLGASIALVFALIMRGVLRRRTTLRAQIC